MPAPQPVAERGFFEQYWAWLVGIVVLVLAALWAMSKKPQ
jgi:hypothetical protein